MRDEILIYGKESILKEECSSCNQPSHKINKCPLLHANSNNDFLILKYLSSVRQKRFIFRSKMRKKINALFIKNYQEITITGSQKISYLFGNSPTSSKTNRAKLNFRNNFLNSSSRFSLKLKSPKFKLQKRKSLEIENKEGSIFSKFHSPFKKKKKKYLEENNTKFFDGFSIKFDKMKNFSNYFTHNNSMNVLDKMKKFK